MNIAILGTRGIPNHYGGFEQFAEHLSVGLVRRGHTVTVYNSRSHPYQENDFKGVIVRHMYDPENNIGTAGQFVYDFLSILDTRKRDYDIILQLGYTSSSLFFNFHPRRSIILTNMDGLEWKRTKYSKYVQRFLLWAESLAVKRSDYLISDSLGIQEYLKNKYARDSIYIPYGADLFETPEVSILAKYDLKPYGYNMLIARLEPENSIEMILDGVIRHNRNIPFLVIGRHDTTYGNYLKKRFSDQSIRFLGPIYTLNILNNFRYFSNLYFHGHTVGGTNPSLLEAMGSNALICAHDNLFNRAILNDNGFYFSNSDHVLQVLKTADKKQCTHLLCKNKEEIAIRYSWKSIVQLYEKLFLDILKVSGGSLH